MNRYDFYYRQRVMEDQLDNAFSACEDGILNLTTDLNLGRDASNAAQFGGILSGFGVSHTSGMQVSIAAGVGYDEDGKRIATDTAYTVTLTNIGSVTEGSGGTPGGASAEPALGYERWLTVFIAFDRNLSDPHVDGYGSKVYFQRTESFHFVVTMGSSVLIGNLNDGHKPARQDNMLLLADVHVKNLSGTTEIVIPIDSTRAETFFKVTATGGSSPLEINSGDLRVILKQLLEDLSDHVNGLTHQHPATAITFTGTSSKWADGTGGAFASSAYVQDALENIIEDLKKTVAVGGSKRIGSIAQSVGLSAPSFGSPASLTAGTLESQLTTLLTAVNGRVFRGGDTGIGDLIPGSNKTLGNSGNPWDVVARDLDVQGSVKTDLIPSQHATHKLGTNSLAWHTLYTSDIKTSGLTVNGETWLWGTTIGGTGVFDFSRAICFYCPTTTKDIMLPLQHLTPPTAEGFTSDGWLFRGGLSASDPPQMYQYQRANAQVHCNYVLPHLAKINYIDVMWRQWNHQLPWDNTKLTMYANRFRIGFTHTGEEAPGESKSEWVAYGNLEIGQANGITRIDRLTPSSSEDDRTFDMITDTLHLRFVSPSTYQYAQCEVFFIRVNVTYTIAQVLPPSETPP